ncbi:MAG: FG-GAP-like repeat-containing protein [Pirellulaceae bacterium]|nr:FG-GAP-like repeat-containing protein [Pirellulaceae bacterium]
MNCKLSSFRQYDKALLSRTRTRHDVRRYEQLEARELLAFTAMPNVNVSGSSVAWADFNNDGFTDLHAGSLYQNNGGNGFTQVNSFGTGSWGDYDNDGWLDYALKDAGMVYKNVNGNSFTGIEFGENFPNGPKEASTFFDLGGDGDLDVYIAGYENEAQGFAPVADVIYEYDSDTGTFLYNASPGGRNGRGLAVLDYNEDLLDDVYVTNYRLQANNLWENSGSSSFSTFSDVASSMGATGGHGHGGGSSVGDYNNDGHIDIFAQNFAHPGQPESRFLINKGPAGNYAFEDWGTNGVAFVESYLNSATGDVDNDGDLDVWLSAVYGESARLYVSNLGLSTGSFSVSEATGAYGLSGVGVTTQGAFGDMDNDGDLDFVTNNGTVYVNDTSQTTSNNWLRVKLVGNGINVNAMAFGTVVRANLGNGVILSRHVEGASGRGSNQNEQTLHFGLGSHSGPVPLEITWRDGTLRNVTVDPNQTITIPYSDLPGFAEIPIGETGHIATLSNIPQTISLSNTYSDPVVFAQSATANGQQPVVVRVTDVMADQFTIYLAEPSNEDGIHGSEAVSYVVLEKGNHTLASGEQLEVGTIDTSATVGTLLNNLWHTVTFQDSFDTVPVLMSQVQTRSPSGEDYLQTRQSMITATGFEISLEQEEAITTPHHSETIGYLAMDKSSGSWNGLPFEIGYSQVNVGQDLIQINFGTTFSNAPNVLTSLSSYLGSDNAHLRYASPTTTSVLVKVEEDTTFDEELNHTAERVAFLAIDGAGLLTGLEPQMNIGKVGAVTNLTNLPQVILLGQSYDNPVVFAQSASTEGQSPVVVRVSNVQPDRFTIFLAEASNDDGSHREETVSFVVLEAGTHQLIDGTRLEVGTVDSSATVGRLVANQWEPVSFSAPFSDAPVLFTQIQTTNDGNAGFLKTRHDAAANTGFSVALESEEQISNQHSKEESIGYFAIQAGTGTWGKLTYEAGTVTNVTDQFTSHSFGTFYSAPPAFLSSMGTYAGQDNAHVRYTNLSGNSVEVKIEEDTTFDTEIAHSNEVVNYLTLGGQGSLFASRPFRDIGEIGQIPNLTDSPQSVSLIGQYINPVVFAQSASANGGQPITVRVKNIQSDRFEIYLAEPSNEDGSHGAESVSYLVLEAGTHQLHNGVHVEVGTVTTTATVGHNMDNTWEPVSFSSPFTQTPAILSQIQTASAQGDRYLNVRHSAESTEGVSLALEPEEVVTTEHMAETIGYVAMTAGSSAWSGLPFEADRTPVAVTHDWYDHAFNIGFTDPPALLSSLATYNGTNSSNVRFNNITQTGVQFKVSEETTLDTEINHYSPESISYLAIGGVGLITAVAPSIPPQVTNVQRNSGNDTQDLLDSLAYTFHEDVTVTSDALQLHNTSMGGVAVDLAQVGFAYDTASLTATWDFIHAPALPPAWYTATLDATKVSDTSGLALDGNQDTTPGDDHAHLFLIAARGDTDMDGDVDISDFNTLGQNYDPNRMGGTIGWENADFDGDGDVDIADFNSLVRNFSPLGYASLPSLSSHVSEPTVIAKNDGVAAPFQTVRSDATTATLARVDRSFANWDANDHLFVWDEITTRRRLRKLER